MPISRGIKVPKPKNVIIREDLWRRLKIKAKARGLFLSKALEEAIAGYLGKGTAR